MWSYVETKFFHLISMVYMIWIADRLHMVYFHIIDQSMTYFGYIVSKQFMLRYIGWHFPDESVSVYFSWKIAFVELCSICCHPRLDSGYFWNLKCLSANIQQWFHIELSGGFHSAYKKCVFHKRPKSTTPDCLELADITQSICKPNAITPRDLTTTITRVFSLYLPSFQNDDKTNRLTMTKVVPSAQRVHPIGYGKFA